MRQTCIRMTVVEWLDSVGGGVSIVMHARDRRGVEVPDDLIELLVQQ